MIHLSLDDVEFRVVREDIYDEEGNLVARQVPHLAGEIIADSGVIYGYVVMLHDESLDKPQHMEHYRLLVTHGLADLIEKEERDRSQLV